MDIKIIETKEIETLDIIDPSTGINWINDLMGNHNALPKFDDMTGFYLMKKEDFDWWQELTESYQEADDRFYLLIRELDEDAADQLLNDGQNINCDLEDLPSCLNQLCDEYETT